MRLNNFIGMKRDWSLKMGFLKGRLKGGLEERLGFVSGKDSAKG
jgi:hypothetical protein